MLALISFASCNNNPHNVDPEPTPAPEPTPEPDLDSVPTDEEHAAVLEGLAYYRLTATKEMAKRFALQYTSLEGFEPSEGSVLTLKYRTNGDVDRLYIRDSHEAKYLPDSAKYHQILATDDPYVSLPDEDGWITFTFTFPAMEDPETGVALYDGIRLEFGSYGLGGFADGDYLEIRDLALDGTKLTISPAGEDEEYQSSCGIWNNNSSGNTDHTFPALTVIYF